MTIPTYNLADFKSPDTGFHRDGLWIRPGIIRATDHTTGLVDIEWLDYPGIRQGVSLTQPHQGMFQFPTTGAVVLIGFDQAGNAQILRYLPTGYQAQINDADLWAIKPGEINLVSYRPESTQTENFPIPNTTGSQIYMDNSGNIQITTALGEKWLMHSDTNTIAQESMNYNIITEAGRLQFGLVKRASKSSSNAEFIITPEGTNLEDSTSADPNALTEFRLRLLDQADANPDTAPELDNPFIELSLGIKVDSSGNIETTDGNTHAETSGENQEIIIQLKTKADQGFEFTVDKEGNVTFLTNGNIKLKTLKAANIEIGGNADIIVGGDLTVDASKISLGGSNKLVLDTFLSTYNNHTHGSSTGPTTPPIEKSLPFHTSNTTEAG